MASRNITSLPIELQAHILSFLDWKTHTEIAKVCQKWLSLVKTPNFVKMRYTQMSENYYAHNLLVTWVRVSIDQDAYKNCEPAGIASMELIEGGSLSQINIPLDSILLDDPFFYPFWEEGPTEDAEALKLREYTNRCWAVISGYEDKDYPYEQHLYLPALHPWVNVSHLAKWTGLREFSQCDIHNVSLGQVLDWSVKWAQREAKCLKYSGGSITFETTTTEVEITTGDLVETNPDIWSLMLTRFDHNEFSTDHYS